MGNFYVNFVVANAGQDRVSEVLETAERVAIVMPAQNGHVVVFDEEADSQDVGVITELGTSLSRELDVPVLAFLNHDDDVLCYWLFERGWLTDAFCSDEEFGAMADVRRTPDAARLCGALGRADHRDAVERLLQEEQTFAIDLHQNLAEELALPSYCVGFGYTYVSDGELDEELRNASGAPVWVGSEA